MVVLHNDLIITVIQSLLYKPPVMVVTRHKIQLSNMVRYILRQFLLYSPVRCQEYQILILKSSFFINPPVSIYLSIILSINTIELMSNQQSNLTFH
jgi:hypothetical protein